MQWGCNAWAYNNKSTKPSPKNSQKSQNPKKKKKNPKPRSKNAWMHEKEGLRGLTRWLELGLGWTWSGWRDLRERKSVWVERERFLSRKKWENENWIAPQLYIEKCISMDRGFVEHLSSTKSRQKWNYW